jgi:hypothetical protein
VGKLLCALGRHTWLIEITSAIEVREREPYEVCGRCRHYRNDGSVLDGPSTGPPAPRWTGLG